MEDLEINMLVTEFNSKFSSLSEKQVEKGYMNSHLSLIKKGGRESFIVIICTAAL
jgi:hypothetical protein